MEKCFFFNFRNNANVSIFVRVSRLNIFKECVAALSLLLGFQQSLLRSSCFQIVLIRAKDLVCILVSTLHSKRIIVGGNFKQAL